MADLKMDLGQPNSPWLLSLTTHLTPVKCIFLILMKLFFGTITIRKFYLLYFMQRLPSPPSDCRHVFAVGIPILTSGHDDI